MTDNVAQPLWRRSKLGRETDRVGQRFQPVIAWQKFQEGPADKFYSGMTSIALSDG